MSFQARTELFQRKRNKQIEIHLSSLPLSFRFLLPTASSSTTATATANTSSLCLGVLKPVTEDMRCIIKTNVETISSAVRRRETQALRSADSISKNNIAMFVQLETTKTKSEKLSQMSKDRLLIYHRWKRLIIELSVHKYTQAADTRSIEKKRQRDIHFTWTTTDPISSMFSFCVRLSFLSLFDANQSVSHVSLTPFHINISRAWTNVILSC